MDHAYSFGNTTAFRDSNVMGSYKIINNLLTTMVPNSRKKSTHRLEVRGDGPFQKLIL